MIKTLLTAGSVVANTNVPLTLLVNTNSKTSLGTNAIVLNTTGLWDVKANIVFTATATGDVTARLFADGVAVSGALETTTVATGDDYTCHINDVVRTVPSIGGNVALTLQFDQAVTIVNGDFIVEYAR